MTLNLELAEYAVEYGKSHQVDYIEDIEDIEKLKQDLESFNEIYLEWLFH